MGMSEREVAKGTPKRVRISHLTEKKRRGEKISVLTAYDYTLARLLDRSGVDAILVGDSMGMVALGYDTTLPVTLDQMVHHTAAVRRGVKRALLVADMPFLTYEVTPEQTLANAGRLMQEAGADAVKLEGGREIQATVRRLVDAGIPVMGHLGMTPQSVHQMGGFRVQGKTAEAADKLIEDAKALEAAGAFGIVLELIPAALSRRVSEAVTIPTIGIGAGPACDGQVLVAQDMLGMFDELQPRFVKKYATLGQEIEAAVRRYVAEVQEGVFPAAEHSIDPLDGEAGSGEA